MNITSSYGTIASPGYGLTNYLPQQHCFWYINEPDNQALTLVFNPVFHTEHNVDVIKVSFISTS